MIKKVKLGDICEVRGGYAFKSIDFQKQGIPVIRISNISDNSVLLDDKTVFVDSVSQDMLQKYSIHKGDILVALSGATTGKFGIYEEDTDNLVLLYLYVGSGSSTSDIDYKFTRKWADVYTVIIWDQHNC